MVTPDELLRVLLAPLLVSAIIAVIGYWRRWVWALPLAAGGGFIVGYGLMGVPKLPPQDGTDWLFWLAMPLTVAGMGSALLPQRWRWPVAVMVGAVAFGVIRPLFPNGASIGQVCTFSIGAAVAGLLLALAATLVETRLSPLATVLSFSLTLGAAAVLVMSSNLRIVGVYGIAAAAVGPAAIFAGPLAKKGLRYRTLVSPGVAIVAAGLLAGLLAGGRFYPDPGMTWTNLLAVSLAPLLLLAAAWLPIKSVVVRAIIGLVLVSLALAAVTVPTALAAKHAAEADPYGSNG